jgi:Flp pilus assembly protein TadB
MYALKLGLAAIGFLVVGFIGILVFGGIWSRVGIGAAIVIVCGGLLFFAWRMDRRERARRAGLDDI